MSVRPAVPADMPSLLSMAVAGHAESAQRHLPVNWDKVRAHFLEWMRADCFLVAMRDGYPIGFLIGFVGPHWFSDELGAWDRYVYVRPEHRGSGAFYTLYKAFRRWAEAKGAVDVWPAVSTGSHQGVKAYQALDLECVGAVFRERLQVPVHHHPPNQNH